MNAVAAMHRTVYGGSRPLLALLPRHLRLGGRHIPVCRPTATTQSQPRCLQYGISHSAVYQPLPGRLLISSQPARCRTAWAGVVHAEPPESWSAGAGPNAASSTAEPGWCRWLGPLVKVLAGLLASTVLLTALAPALLSTRWGLRTALAAVNALGHGHVAVQELQVGWRKPLLARGITLHDGGAPDSTPVASVARISTTRGLLPILTGKHFDAVIAEPRVDCSLDDSGDLRLLHALQGQRKAGTVLAAAPSSSRTAELEVTADARLLNGHLFVSDGRVTLPEEVKLAVGSDLHVTAVMGDRNVQDSAAELGLSADWAARSPAQPDVAQPASSDAPGSAAEAAEAAAAQAPPPAVPGRGRRGVAKRDPLLLLVNSEHVTAEVSGWRTADGLLLRQPATARADFTPALARQFLARLNPLLGNAVAMRRGASVAASVAPAGLALPADAACVRVAPMHLEVARGPLLDNVVRLLGLSNRGIGKARTLSAWTSVLEAEYHAGGAVTSKRLDILLGANDATKGIHLAVWGRVDPASQELDMTLGVPADTLALAGARGLPPDYVLRLPLRGTLHAPHVDWARASQDLARLVVQGAAQQAAGPEAAAGRGLLGSALQRLGVVGRGGRGAEAAAVPPPVAPLPWLDADLKAP